MSKLDKELKETLEGLFGSLMDGEEKETSEDFKDSILKLSDFITDLDRNFLLNYRLDNVMKAVLAIKYPKAEKDALRNIVEIYRHHDFYDNNITEITSSLEGWQCSSDRASFIIKALLRHFGEGQDFDVMPKEDDEYTYHKPKVLNNEAWLKLFEALVRLRYGKNDLYLKWFAGYFIPASKG